MLKTDGRMEILDPTPLRLAALVESSHDAIISHSLDGCIETWNPAAERMFGYRAAEVLGRSIDIIVSDAHRLDERQLMDRLRTGEPVSHLETVAVTREGTFIPISVSVSPVLTPDGRMVGVSRIARDLSRQKALEREAFRLAAIVDSSEDAIVSKDLNGIVQTWNKAAERMFGYTAADMVGQSILRIIPQDRRAEEDEVLRRIRAGLSVDHFETIRRRKDGTLIEISLTVSPIRTPTGAIIGASKIARDITIQRQLARVKDEFLATLSHELRTPLNAVLGYTRMLRLGHINPDQHERVIEIIERNAATLAQLVSDVLDVSSVVTGKIRLNAQPCELRAIVQGAVDVVRPSAEAKGVALHVDPSPVPLPASCDVSRAQQVFWNMMSNAVKFTPRGGRVDVRVRARGDVAEVTVADTGAGIKAESLPYVFQRFWQAESGRGGLGLGLALARHFVELHGGTIAVASAGEGQGATFTVTLPLAADAGD